MFNGKGFLNGRLGTNVMSQDKDFSELVSISDEDGSIQDMVRDGHESDENFKVWSESAYKSLAKWGKLGSHNSSGGSRKNAIVAYFGIKKGKVLESKVKTPTPPKHFNQICHPMLMLMF